LCRLSAIGPLPPCHLDCAISYHIMKLIVSVVVIFFLASGVCYEFPPLQWGQVGHALVASVAQALLSPNASQSVINLLPDVNGSMAAVASWADQIRKTYPWSAELHYINTPDWVCDYSYNRDCQLNGVMGICVDGAIQNYTQRLLDMSLPFDQQNEALKFLIHFVGDIHQPLHCGFTTDKGGNTFEGHFNGKKVNLHEIWDTSIVVERIDNDFHGNQSSYLSYLVTQIQGAWSNQASGWSTCVTPSKYSDCSGDWAAESITDACQYSYVEADGKTHIQTGFDLGDPYYQRNMPVVEMQIAKAGVRLATVLNALFNPQ